jgi:hypothetical protein
VQIELIKQQLQDEKTSNDLKSEELRKKSHSIQDSYLQNKINYEKEIALSKQQVFLYISDRVPGKQVVRHPETGRHQSEETGAPPKYFFN